MQNSLLLNLCRSFSKSDWKSLRQFTAQSRDDVRLLLAYLEQQLPKNKEKSLEKEFVFPKIYPSRTYNDIMMRHLMHLTYTEVLDFLATLANRNDIFSQKNLLLRELRLRKQDRHFEIEYEKITQQLDNQTLQGFDFYYNSFLAHSENYEYNIVTDRTSMTSFKSMTDALNTFFIGQKLRQACAALSHKALSKSDVTIDFLPEILSFIQQNEHILEIPLVAIYFHIYHAISDLEDKTHFHELKKILLEKNVHFNMTERKELFIHGINCCIQRMNKGQTEYQREVFELYQKGLENKVLIDDNTLSRFTYKNIATLGAGLEEFEWTEVFLYEYKDFIEEKFREGTFQHSLAAFYFRKKDYDKCMELLRNVEFEDVLHDLDVRRMLLRIYYDLGEFEALDAHLETFKTFIYRQRDLGYHRDAYLNLIRFTKKISNEKGSKHLIIKQLKIDIENTNPMIEKTWLLSLIA